MVKRILRWYEVTDQMRSVSLRYFNAAGASLDGQIGEDRTYSQNLVPLVMKSLLLSDYRLKVFGDDYDTADRTCIRCYIHIEDLADPHVKALTHLASAGDSAVVNVGTGSGSSVLDVTRPSEAHTGRTVPFDLAPRRAGDPVATYAQPDLAEQLLGWKAVHGLDRIVSTAYDWHAAQVAGGR